MVYTDGYALTRVCLFSACVHLVFRPGLPAAKCRAFDEGEINQEEGKMYRGAGMHGGGAKVLETGGYEENLPGTDCQHVVVERYSTRAIIEISDKDYRSFCWPCHALEEAGDCK